MSDPIDFDFDPFDEEDSSSDEEWVEISNIEGKTASLRHLATVKVEEKVYYILGAMREFEGRTEKALMIIREDRTMDGALQHVIANDEHELEQVVAHLVGHALSEQLLNETAFDADDLIDSPCGCRHLPGEFCYCDDPAYLQ